MKHIALIALVALVFSACQTIPVPQREGRVRHLIGIINEAPLDELVSYSATPFAFDTELLVLESDLYLIWEGLRAVGFSFEDAEIVQIRPANEQTYAEFAQSYEMRIFFEEYVSEAGSVVHLRHHSGEYMLLLDGNRNRTPLVYGIKGPLS